MDPTNDQPVVASHIEYTPGVRSGKACIRGTRVSVSDVVLWTEQGMSPDLLVSEFPQLTLADVFAALAYYYDNKSMIDRQIQEGEEFGRNLERQLSPSQIELPVL